MSDTRGLVHGGPMRCSLPCMVDCQVKASVIPGRVRRFKLRRTRSKEKTRGIYTQKPTALPLPPLVHHPVAWKAATSFRPASPATYHGDNREGERERKKKPYSFKLFSCFVLLNHKAERNIVTSIVNASLLLSGVRTRNTLLL